MAHVVTNHGLEHMQSNDMGSADIRAAVFTGTMPAAATVRDWDDLQDVIDSALVEAAATNYARQDLASVAVTENDGSDNVTITADDATINSVGAGETWTVIAYYIFNASDSAATLLSCDEVTGVPTNGGNMTIPGPSYTIAQA